MLLDYITDGGVLMGLLVSILFVCLLLIIYAALVLAGEVMGTLRFRRERKALGSSLDLDRVEPLTAGVKSVPARFLASLGEELEMREGRLAPADRKALAVKFEDELLAGATWPLDVLHFLAEYASKVGLFGTILGLCLHFLTFGSEGDSTLASHAMAIALYTTLGALVIALVAEPSAFLLEKVEGWIRRELDTWFRYLERGLIEGELARASVDGVRDAAAARTASGPPPELDVAVSEESGS